MTESDKTTETGNAETTDAKVEVADTNADADGATQATKVETESSSKRTGTRPAWLALLLALVALALATQELWMPAGPDPEVADPSALAGQQMELRLEQLQARLAELNQALVNTDSDLRAAIDALPAPPDTGGLDARQQELVARLERLAGQHATELGALRGRLEALESEFSVGIGNLSARLDQAGRQTARNARELVEQLRLIEIRQLLDMAENAVAISGDRQTATAALRQLNRRAAAGDRPGWSLLSEASSADLAALEAWLPAIAGEDIDRLLSAAESVPRWPIAERTAGPPAGPAQSGQAQDWRARLSQVFGELVRVESLDPGQLSPVEADLARQRIRSLLEVVALTLARREHELSMLLIEKTRLGIEQSFDVDHRDAAATLSLLGELRQALHSPASPPPPERSRRALERLEQLEPQR